MDKIFDEIHYILSYKDNEIGLNTVGSYDTTSPHLWCRQKLYDAAKAINDEQMIVTITNINNNKILEIKDLNEFMNWMTNIFECNQADFHGFSNFIRKELKNN